MKEVMLVVMTLLMYKGTNAFAFMKYDNDTK